MFVTMKGSERMTTKTHSHKDGKTIIPSQYVKELRQTIENYKKKLGLYKITDFKEYLIPAIQRKGWSDKYYLDRTSKITITSMKDETGLCIQTGNMARMYADILKLQALYSRNIISGGILVVATSACGRSFGGNVASYERIIRELDIFDQVITMPLMIIGFGNEEA